VTDAKHPELPGFEERFLDARGCRLRYLVAGEGEPAMLVHGLGGAGANWLALAPLLLAGRRLLVPDLPGHGGSAPLPAAPSLNAYADRLGLLLEHEGIASAAVVGHSLGGAVAVRLAIRRPDLVTALVLAGAAGISSATRTARYALTITGILKPGRRIAPHRRPCRPSSSRLSSSGPRAIRTRSARRRRSSATTSVPISIAFAVACSCSGAPGTTSSPSRTRSSTRAGCEPRCA
jgi:pimeloyl-ACP methyl ester carboxylesterase